MEPAKKIIVTSESNLKTKYGADFTKLEGLLDKLIAADKKRNIETLVVYIDNEKSAEKVNITAVKSITRQTTKKAIDAIYKENIPAYLVILGAQDIIPFQELINPVPYDPEHDSDKIVPSDLPYACDAPYSNKVGSFTGPSRVIGRIPDIPGQSDLTYLTTLINTIINHEPFPVDEFMEYFSVTAFVWTKSTKQSLNNIFGNSTNLKDSPPSTISYLKKDISPLIHFYNCHGSPIDSKFYGQDGNQYPTAMESTDLIKKVSAGTVVAAECCYGSELFNPVDEGKKQMGIANTYLANNAVAFVGSSTIAYGPPAGQGLADLITQYFIKNILSGASTGRAFLEATQNFLSVSGTLDPYEMKTLAQFYLLGDPSLQSVSKPENEPKDETLDSRRLSLKTRGINLAKTIDVSKQVKPGTLTTTSAKTLTASSTDIEKVLEEIGFSGEEKQYLFEVTPKNIKVATFAKGITGNETINYRAFVKKTVPFNEKIKPFEVLVIKESGGALLSWKLYQTK